MDHLFSTHSSVDRHLGSYCKYCGYEHWGACIFWNHAVLGGVYAQEWECWVS